MRAGVWPCFLLVAAVFAAKSKTRNDPEDNKGNTPFFLQDES